jgi:Carboxymuconolactone decarboxylase family
MAGQIQYRGGLNAAEDRPLTWGESTPTEKIDATTIDVLTIAQAIVNGKPYAAGAAFYTIARRDKMNAEQVGEVLAAAFSGGELGQLLALTLAVLGASKAK